MPKSSRHESAGAAANSIDAEIFALENEEINELLRDIDCEVPGTSTKTRNESPQKLQQTLVDINRASEGKEEPKKQTTQAKKPSTKLAGAMVSDQEHHERKRQAAALYQKFKNRSSCLNHGCKEVPQGKPNCLAGLTFLVTGVLESLERDEATALIQKYGGKVKSTVDKRLNYLIVGNEPGLKKLTNAAELHIKMIDEDEFFDLILEKSVDSKIIKNKLRTILSDEERHERKRKAAALYQKFKNRSSCLNHGCKEVPKGKPNCLAGLTFLVTGVLESLERDEAASIVKEYGGKVMTTVGKRLNYFIAGVDAGPKKLADAEELHIKVINEDEFFDLIREKSDDAAAKIYGDNKAEKMMNENFKEAEKCSLQHNK